MLLLPPSSLVIVIALLASFKDQQGRGNHVEAFHIIVPTNSISSVPAAPAIWTTAAAAASDRRRPPSLSTKEADSSLLLLRATGKGFGNEGEPSKKDKKKKISVSKTYGTDIAASKKNRDVIDQEGAMMAFFSTRQEWLPLFKSVAGTDLPDDTRVLMANYETTTTTTTTTTEDESIIGDGINGPWRSLDPVPDHPDDRAVLEKFLDSMHQSLLDIPVNEVVDPEEEQVDDEDDLHFLEEGRRMLAITRFHVLRNNRGGSVEKIDSLFEICWSELLALCVSDEPHTGSIILLPDYDLQDLRRFTDMNIVSPLLWLGIHHQFEVVSMQRDSPAIRLLYKLQDMPSNDNYTEEEGFAAGP